MFDCCWLCLGCFGATGPSGTLGGSTAPFGGGGLGLNLGGMGTGTSLFQQSQAKPTATGLGFTGGNIDYALLSVSVCRLFLDFSFSGIKLWSTASDKCNVKQRVSLPGSP